MSPKHLPTTYEGKLDHIIEECSEVIKVVLKIKRFGLTSEGYDNLSNLIDEVEDVVKATDNFLKHIDSSL